MRKLNHSMTTEQVTREIDKMTADEMALERYRLIDEYYGSLPVIALFGRLSEVEKGNAQIVAPYVDLLRDAIAKIDYSLVGLSRNNAVFFVLINVKYDNGAISLKFAELKDNAFRVFELTVAKIDANGKIDVDIVSWIGSLLMVKKSKANDANEVFLSAWKHDMPLLQKYSDVCSHLEVYFPYDKSFNTCKN